MEARLVQGLVMFELLCIGVAIHPFGTMRAMRQSSASWCSTYRRLSAIRQGLIVSVSLFVGEYFHGVVRFE